MTTKENNITDTVIPWGPTGEVVYDRTYSRVKPNGERETWPETVTRVAAGNLGLVYGPPDQWTEAVWQEFDRLSLYMNRFAILPAGRHLWASGVKGRQYLFNCHVSGWGEKLSKHFEFTSMRLFEGGGVGANYSSRLLSKYGAPRRSLKVHVVCDPSHPDYEELKPHLSTEYDSEWAGAWDVEDSREGWAAALVDLLDTYMTDDEVKHENRVYDVSRVRRKGARLKSSGGTASGPAPFAVMMLKVADVMNGAHSWNEAARIIGLAPASLSSLDAMQIDHAIAEAVVAGGNRRSARMAIVHWQDPYIFDFINAKADGGNHWTTNISVEIDNEFLDLLNSDEACDNEGCPCFHARKVHAAVVEGMLTNGEPGYWNSDLSNDGEPNRVEATNPCGEIALEAWENCNLGHVNLDAFAPTRKGGAYDQLGLIEAHRLVTRFLIRATYGDVNDEDQAEKLARNRRIGVGHLGVQGFWAKRGVRFSDVPRQKTSGKFLRELYDVVRDAARAYAFELRIPEPVKVTTVAPTGSIAKLPGVTEGIHPIYGRYFIRRVRFSLADADQANKVLEFIEQGLHVEPCQYDASGNTMVVSFPTKDQLVAEVEALGIDVEVVQSADELTVRQMLAFQAMYQTYWADNAVSFTVNVPEGLDHAVVSTALVDYLPSLKGTTIMVDGTRAQAPYERITREAYEAGSVQLVEDGTDEDCASGACPVR